MQLCRLFSNSTNTVMSETPERDVKENQLKNFRKDLLFGQSHGQPLIHEAQRRANKTNVTLIHETHNVINTYAKSKGVHELLTGTQIIYTVCSRLSVKSQCV